MTARRWLVDAFFYCFMMANVMFYLNRSREPGDDWRLYPWWSLSFAALYLALGVARKIFGKRRG